MTHASSGAYTGRHWGPCFLALILMGISCASWAQHVLAVSEESVPFQYTRAGTVAGPAADLVRQTMRRAGLQHEVQLYPWPRAYSMAQRGPNVLIFSMARTEAREPQFKWVGEVYPAEFCFIKLKTRTDIVVKSLDDVRKYSVGVINQDVTHEFLVKQRFSPDKLDVTASNDINFAKLAAGRVDLILRSKRALGLLCQRDKAMCDKMETSYVVSEMKTSLWMAFSKSTPDAVVARARTAYNGLRADGSWSAIMRAIPN